MNQQLSMKVQLGEKIKMLPKASYETLGDLSQAVQKSYPKRLQDKNISLKYADEEGDWLYLSEDDDLTALNEFATKSDKKVKLVIEVKKSDQKDMEVDQVSQAMAEVSLEEEKQAKFEDLKDFKFADASKRIEDLLNSEDKFGLKKIWKVLEEEAEGTKAEQHFKRMNRQFKKCGGKHRRGKMFRKFFSKSTSHERDGSSSEEKLDHPGYGSPFHYGPHAGFGGPFAHGPPHGHGHGHGPWGGKRAQKFFKKFMMSFRSSSSDSSSEERRERRKARKEMRKCNKRQGPAPKKLEFTVKEETVVGKIGQSVNFTVNVKDIAPHPIWLTGAKKIEGDVAFEDQAFEEAKVFREKEHEATLVATLPAEAGEYPVTIGFLNKKGNVVPGNLTLNFRAE